MLIAVGEGPVKRVFCPTSSIRILPAPGSRAWRLNRSRSLISVDFDDRRCVSGSALQYACSARAQSTCCRRGDGGLPVVPRLQSIRRRGGRYFVGDRLATGR